MPTKNIGPNLLNLKYGFILHLVFMILKFSYFQNVESKIYPKYLYKSFTWDFPYKLAVSRPRPSLVLEQMIYPVNPIVKLD